eukprot:2982865-Prymnesium_polylepis.1
MATSPPSSCSPPTAPLACTPRPEPLSKPRPIEATSRWPPGLPPAASGPRRSTTSTPSPPT